MAFLPSIQEAPQSHTGGILLFQTEQQKSLASNLDQVSQDYLELGHYWGGSNLLGYTLESITGATKAASSTVLFESLTSKEILDEMRSIIQPGCTFITSELLEKQLSRRGVGALKNWYSHSRPPEEYYRLVLDLQDLYLRGQIWKENGWLSANYLTTSAQSLEYLYNFRKPIEVYQFLEMNSFLISLLEDAYTHIRQYFPSSNLSLEVVSDSEAMDEQQLVAFIAVKQNLEEASEALDHLDQDWWLDAIEMAQDKLCITLEFQ